MYYWASFPFLRISLALIFGVFAGHFVNISQEHLTVLFGITIGLFILISLGKIIKVSVHHSVSGNLLLLVIFLLGVIRYENYDLSEAKSNQTTKLEKCLAYEGIVTSYPMLKNGKVQYEIEATHGINDSLIIPLHSKIILTEGFKNHSLPSLSYGDKFIIKSTPRLIISPKNQYAFNYSAYMAHQNIYFQDKVEAHQIHVLSSFNGNILLTAIFRIRRNFEKTIIKFIKNPDEQSIVKALLLGIKGGLDYELKSSYAAAGAMHILAVSGLHVAIIFIFLKTLFRFIPSYKFNKYIAPIISIIVLWLYALLTGFSPSILRAATMLSIIIFGQSLNRKTNIFNSLALGAFILLLYNPSFIFSVGFQLSFLAVGGIVYIHPLLISLLNPSNIVLKSIWSLTCVSIAAQIATFPLSIYYFHQFPTYFLFSNLIVILAACIIMGVGILMLGFSQTWAGSYLGNSLSTTTSLLNQFVQFVHQLEGSVVEWLFITSSQLFVIYVAIFSVFALLRFKKIKFAWMIFISIMFFSLEKTLALYKQANTQSITFYSINNNHVMDKTNGLKTKLYSLYSIQNTDRLEYHINPERINNYLPPMMSPTPFINQPDSSFDFAHFNVFQRKKILYLIKPFKSEKIRFMIQTDILVISNNSVKSLEEIKTVIQFKELILDSTNDYFYTNRIEKEAKSLKLNLRNINSGYYKITDLGNQVFLDFSF